MTANQVSTLGSLHGFLLKNPQYSLYHFIAAIYTFKPDIILTEVRPEAPGPIEGSIDGGIEQTVVYAVADDLSIPVVPVDWFDDDLIEQLNKENDQMPTEAKNEVEPHWQKYTQDFGSLSLLELNSKTTQNQIKTIYTIYEKYGLTASRKRNIKILENIKAELKQINNKRVLIVFGLDHKFFIDEELQAYHGQQVLPVSDWAQSLQINKSNFASKTTKQKILNNLISSNQVLKNRLESNFYKGEMSERLKKKLQNFETWENFVLEM